MEQLKKGYKKTEVGVIPEDWLISSIGDILSIKHGKDQKGVQNVNGQYPILGTGGVMGYTDSYLYNKESVLIGRKGTIDKPKFMNNPFWTVDTLFYSEIKNDVFAKYIYYKFLQINWYSYNEASGVPSLNAKTIEGINITIPPTLTEQKAIADALTDVDELITNLEKLIAKKKAIKQGAMQQLLTPPHKGGKRLEGFSGDWKKVKLGELGNTYGGLSGKAKGDFVNGMYPYINFLNVMNNTIIKRNGFGMVSIKNNEKQNQAQLGDLFFNTSSETPEEVGMCAVLLDEIPNLYLNSFCFGFRLNNKYETSGLFLSYYFNSPVGRQHFLSLAQGATRYNLSKSNFNQIEFYLPEIVEQNAIATFFNDIEFELEYYNKKLQKCQQIKQGMMQELLTGKTRLT